MPQPMEQLAALFEEMETAYDTTARLLDFSCQGCSDNCCNSYFRHHTYIEWAYLRRGFAALPEERRQTFLSRAEKYVQEAEQALARGERPEIMCPLNDEGRCGLYTHRMLICRLHGVPATMRFPNGQRRSFPGCFRCQEISHGRDNTPAMDRTLFFQRMLLLEREFTKAAGSLPRLKMNIAEMLLKPLPSELG
ncbi:MAG TPA: hypothetical protein ENK33_09400 [Desulfobacterales bacterium]|nr:hypothetical protein [Desulfobacterales bacterium]